MADVNVKSPTPSSGTAETPTLSASTSAPAGDSKASSGKGLQRIVILAAGGLVGLILILFIVALALALFTNVEQSGAVIRLIRDLVIIFLALEGILIVLSLAILVLQVARLVNLLQTEIKPILENTQQTVKTAQTTVEFVSANVTAPIVRLSGFVSGASVLMGQVFGLRKVLKRSSEKEIAQAQKARDEAAKTQAARDKANAELAKAQAAVVKAEAKAETAREKDKA